MVALEELTRGALVEGIEPNGPFTIVDVEWIGTSATDVTYRTQDGQSGSILLYREDEPSLKIGKPGRVWSFDGDGHLLRLVSEAQRIQLAHLFDPLLAVHSSDVDPLPHQITAVYEEMLTRQPLRFLLADDPGAGKTIMTGLFMKELWLRGDLRRCLVVCPGSLVEQWQDELDQKFDLPFEIFTNDQAEASRGGNWFTDQRFVYAAGIVEATAGAALMCGFLPRVVILGLWIPFNLGIPFLPPTELIGHLPILATMYVLLVRSTEGIPPRTVRVQMESEMPVAGAQRVAAETTTT